MKYSYFLNKYIMVCYKNVFEEKQIMIEYRIQINEFNEYLSIIENNVSHETSGVQTCVASKVLDSM